MPSNAVPPSPYLSQNTSPRAWDELAAAGHELFNAGNNKDICNIVAPVLRRFEVPRDLAQEATLVFLNGLLDALGDR